jgi:hypothetical protein
MALGLVDNDHRNLGACYGDFKDHADDPAPRGTGKGLAIDAVPPTPHPTALKNTEWTRG